MFLVTGSKNTPRERPAEWQVRLAGQGNARESDAHRAVLAAIGELPPQLQEELNKYTAEILPADGSEIRVLGTRFDMYRKPTGNVLVTVPDDTFTLKYRPESRSATRQRKPVHP